jgi:hypothetical protein
MNIRDLMARIDTLQEYDEPMVEEYIPVQTVHPLLQAMQELKEDGVIDEYINKDTVNPDFTVEKEIQNGYILKAQGLENGEGIEIKVFDPENVYSSVPIADATFKLNNDDKTLTSSLTTVHHKYQKQGIARAMYQFVHDLGNDIQASKTLLPGGQRMWDAFGSTFNNEPEEPEAQPEKKSLWQRLFKEADAIDEDIAYHGTTDDITEFHPLSHFGTEKAAKDRMTYKKIKDGKIYKVDLDIKNPLTIKDFPGIHYDRLYAFELRDKKLISQKEMEAITTIDDKAELRKALLTKLNELGIDGFVYKNKYEDKGNISYVIVDPSQVKVLSVEPATEEVTEASPNTLEGSFTPDLVESKTWLAKMLAKGLKGKNAGTIYVLGSWYGNMGIFLQQAGVQFDKLVLVEPDEEALLRSKDLLQQIGDEGKLILIHQKAEDAVYEKPGVVINTSCNETGPVFLTKLPDNMLCLLQARNNNENTLFPTEDEEDFIDYFPLEKVYYTGKKSLEDPKINYVRYMKIGRTGKNNVNEGPAGDYQTGGALGLPFPGTYEQEYGNFKQHGQRRMGTLTTEALDSSYPYEVDYTKHRYYFTTEDGIKYKVYFQGKDLVEVAFSAILPGEEENFRPDKTELTGTGNSRKVFGTVIEIVKEYTNKNKPKAVYFSAAGDEPSRIKLYDAMILQVGKALPDYYAEKTLDIGTGKVYMLKRKEKQIDEALDSSYPYRNSKQNPGKDFYFDTEDGQEYKVEFDSIWGDDVSVAFSARGQGDEHKTGITGTGNSRKIFGTVIKIVKDYIRKANPEIIVFSANNSEPSRVRLYNMLASQVNKELPNYNFTDAFSNGGLTTYYLTRDGAKIPTSTKVKAKTGKALDAVFEDNS